MLLGNGERRLPAETVEGGDSPLFITSADFNGNGDGSFQDEAEYEADEEPNGVTVETSTVTAPRPGVANHEGDNVSVFYGNGDGTFQDAVNIDDENGPTVVGRQTSTRWNRRPDYVQLPCRQREHLGIEGTPGTLAISTSSLAASRVRHTYALRAAAQSARRWSVSVGTLPTGLTLTLHR